MISEFPEERETVERLKGLIDSDRGSSLTLDHLVYVLRPRSVESLTRMLERLAFEGAIKRVYRIESPANRGPIATYSSWEEIPEEVPDIHTGTELEVTPDTLVVLYAI